MAFYYQLDSREFMDANRASAPNISYLFIIMVFGCVMLLPGTAELPLLDRDEPRFAQATVEMMERNEWVIPYFNGDYRFDKPVLTYWFMRLGYSIFGINELGARFHSIVSTILTAFVLLWIGARWFAPRVGLYAGLFFLTSFQVLLNGRSCVADMVMILFVALSQLSLGELLTPDSRGGKRFWRLLLYLSLGFGFLAKGPIALLVPMVTLLLLRFVFWRKPLRWSELKLLQGGAIVLIIIGAWGIPALLLTKGQFWAVGMNEHVVRRGVEVFNGRFYSPVFYLITALLSLLPWIAFGPRSIEVFRSNPSFENRFLLAWFLSPYLIFTFYATQLPHYVLPGFAGFFLLLAQSAVKLDSFHIKTFLGRWWFRCIVGLYCLLIATILCFLIAIPIIEPYAPLRFCVWGLLGLLIGFLMIAFHSRAKRFFLLAAAILLITSSLTLFSVGLRRVSPAVQMTEIFEQMPIGSTYLGYGFNEGSLVFYSGGRWQKAAGVKDVEQFLQQDSPHLVVVLETERRLDRFLDYIWHNHVLGEEAEMDMKNVRPQLTALDFSSYHKKLIQGVNMGNTSWVELAVYHKL